MIGCFGFAAGAKGKVVFLAQGAHAPMAEDDDQGWFQFFSRCLSWLTEFGDRFDAIADPMHPILWGKLWAKLWSLACRRSSSSSVSMRRI